MELITSIFPEPLGPVRNMIIWLSGFGQPESFRRSDRNFRYWDQLCGSTVPVISTFCSASLWNDIINVLMITSNAHCCVQSIMWVCISQKAIQLHSCIDFTIPFGLISDVSAISSTFCLTDWTVSRRSITLDTTFGAHITMVSWDVSCWLLVLFIENSYTQIDCFTLGQEMHLYPHWSAPLPHNSVRVRNVDPSCISAVPSLLSTSSQAWSESSGWMLPVVC